MYYQYSAVRIYHNIFPAGFGIGKPHRAFFERLQQLQQRKLRRPLAGYCRQFSARAVYNKERSQTRSENGVKYWGTNYAHNASFAFVAKFWVFIFWCCFYSHKRTGNVQTAQQGPRNFGGRNIAKLAISARGDKSTLRTFLSRFRMLFRKTYCFPTACNYVEVNRSANASGTHIASGTIYHNITYT